MSTCRIDDCGRRVLARQLCSAHYLADRATRMPSCIAAGCAKPQYSRLLCDTHYRRMHSYGRLSLERDAVPPLRDHSPAAPPSYDAMHKRLAKARGSASQHQCVDCGERADHWSYDNADPHERTATDRRHLGMPYSTGFEHYEPRCRRCHALLDARSARAG